MLKILAAFGKKYEADTTLTCTLLSTSLLSILLLQKKSTKGQSKYVLNALKGCYAEEMSLEGLAYEVTNYIALLHEDISIPALEIVFKKGSILWPATRYNIIEACIILLQQTEKVHRKAISNFIGILSRFMEIPHRHIRRIFRSVEEVSYIYRLDTCPLEYEKAHEILNKAVKCSTLSLSR